MAHNNTRGARPFSASTSQPTSRRPQKRSKPPGTREDAEAEAYTFLPSLPKRHRTSAQTLSLSRDEAGASLRYSTKRHDDVEHEGSEGKGQDGDSDDAMGARVRRLAMQIAQDDLEDVERDSEEGSIESDDAWEEEGSDEERWGDVFRDMHGKKRKKMKGKAREVVKKVSELNRDLLMALNFLVSTS